MCDCIIYPLSLLYAAINSVYTPGKVFPKHRRAWLPAYPLSILLCPDIVPTYHLAPNTENTLPPWLLHLILLFSLLLFSFFFFLPLPALSFLHRRIPSFTPTIKFHSISVSLVAVIQDFFRWIMHRISVGRNWLLGSHRLRYGLSRLKRNHRHNERNDISCCTSIPFNGVVAVRWKVLSFFLFSSYV